MQNYKIVKKKDSKLMKFISILVWPVNKNFMNKYTTLGKTIYTPDVNKIKDHILTHELVHVEQWTKYNILFWVLYLFLPLPIGLAWFRWKFEREAYLKELEKHYTGVNFNYFIKEVVNVLWSAYGWCWPKPWMKAWFEKELKNDNS